jgi:hypothetical protein
MCADKSTATRTESVNVLPRRRNVIVFMRDGSGPDGNATTTDSSAAAGTNREQPGREQAEGKAGSREQTDGGTDPSDHATPPRQLPPRDSLDWRGWILVGVVVLSVLVIPLFVLYLPEAHWLLSTVGFSLRQAYLVFPMIPAALLGIVAVWSALRSRPPGT